MGERGTSLTPVIPDSGVVAMDLKDNKTWYVLPTSLPLRALLQRTCV